MSICPTCGHSITPKGAGWPPGYLNAESRFCAKETEAYYSYDHPHDHPEKIRLRKALLTKRESFKEVWKDGYTKEESSKEKEEGC